MLRTLAARGARVALTEAARRAGASSAVASDAAAGIRGFAKRVGKSSKKSSGGRSVSAGEKALQEVPHPRESWTEVADPKSGQTYWWNKSTNQTTALGEPRPETFRLPPSAQRISYIRPFRSDGSPSTMLSMGQMFVFGIGGALGVTFVSVVIRGLTGMEEHDPTVREEFETDGSSRHGQVAVIATAGAPLVSVASSWSHHDA